MDCLMTMKDKIKWSFPVPSERWWWVEVEDFIYSDCNLPSRISWYSTAAIKKIFYKNIKSFIS